jgi:hypothetical protein
MADVVVGLQITSDGEQVSRSVKSIKTELREATQDALNLSRKFGEFSPQALDAAKKVANLKDEVGDFKARVDALNPDAKFRAFSSALQGVAGGFAGVQGAIGLFGTESKELEKQLLKVQSALALSEGINSVLAAQDSFKNLGVLIKGNVTKAFGTLRGAIIATGIGALAVGIGLLIANFETVKKVVLNFIPGLAKVGDFIGKIIQKVTDFAGVTSEASRAYDKLKTSTEGSNNEIDRQIKLLQAQGGQEKKIAELQKQKIDNQLAVIKGNKKQTDEDKKNLLDLANEKAVIDAQERKRLNDIAIQRAEERRKQREEAIKEEENRRAEEIERLKGVEGVKVGIVKDSENELKNSTLSTRGATQIGLLAQDLEKQERDKVNAEAEIAIIQSVAEAKRQQVETIKGLIGQLSSIAGESTAVGKALALANIGIDTAQAFSALTKSSEQNPANGTTFGLAGILQYAAGVIRIAANIKKAKDVLSKVKTPSGGGGGGGLSIPSGGGGAVQAPIAQGISVQQTSSVGTSNVNIKNTDAIKAYVVERDITDSQDRINKIKAAATFGG